MRQVIGIGVGIRLRSQTLEPLVPWTCSWYHIVASDRYKLVPFPRVLLLGYIYCYLFGCLHQDALLLRLFSDLVFDFTSGI